MVIGSFGGNGLNTGAEAGDGTTQQYVCMGFISNGVTTPSVLEATFEDERIKYIDTSAYKAITEDALFYRLLCVNKMKLYGYDKTANIQPKDKPIINKTTFNRLNPNK